MQAPPTRTLSPGSSPSHESGPAVFSTPAKPNRIELVLSAARFVSIFGLVALPIAGVAWFFSEHKELSRGVLTLGAIGIFRYSWLFLNVVRSYLYRFYRFPKLRKAADSVENPFPGKVHFIIPTFKEVPWVTREMIKAVAREARSIPSEVELYITTGGADEDEVVRHALHHCPPNERLQVFLMRQSGKRSGMAYALRAVARNNPTRSPDDIVVLMDGDTLIGENTLRKCLPFFPLLPRMGGLTTNSVALTRGPTWYRKWYDMRFSLRNRYMCSTSLSSKILTLTGRFSLVRAGIATSREFIERVETDFTEDWVYGRIDFKTGDDKSTWYELLRNGWEMFYIPDAHIFSLENASDTPVRESVGKMRRWFGNMLRNNGRAIALGPLCVGPFAWCALVDQRISMWTSLVLPAGTLFLIFTFSPVVICYFLLWVLFTRTVYLLALSVEGHKLHPWDMAMLLFQQWVGSFIKIQTFSDLRRQRWGAARGDAKTESAFFGNLQTALWFAIFLLIIGMLVV